MGPIEKDETGSVTRSLFSSRRDRRSHLGLAEVVNGLAEGADVDCHSHKAGSERSDDRHVHHLPGNATQVRSEKSIRQRQRCILGMHTHRGGLHTQLVSYLSKGGRERRCECERKHQNTKRTMFGSGEAGSAGATPSPVQLERSDPWPLSSFPRPGWGSSPEWPRLTQSVPSPSPSSS